MSKHERKKELSSIISFSIMRQHRIAMKGSKRIRDADEQRLTGGWGRKRKIHRQTATKMTEAGTMLEGKLRFERRRETN